MAQHRCRTVAIVLALSTVCVSVVFVVVYLYLLAESAVALPADNYLKSISGRTTSTCDEVQSPARAAANALNVLAGVNLEVPDLIVSKAALGVTTAKITEAPSPLVAYIVALLKVYTKCPWLGIGFNDGSTYAAKRDPGSEAIVVVMKDAQNVLGQGTCLRNYDLDSNGLSYDLSTGRDSDFCNYDPTQRGWYSSTVTRNAAGWGQAEGESGVYADAESGILIVSATVPLYTASGVLLGVVCADLRLEDISTFLTGLTIGKTGEVFIVENLHPFNLVGASEGAVATVDSSDAAKSTCQCTNGIPSRVRVTDSTSSAIQEGWDRLQDQFGTGSVIGNYSASGGCYDTSSWISYFEGLYMPVLQSTQFSDAYGLNWVVVAVIPGSDYYSYIRRNLWISAPLVAYAIVSAAVASRWFSYQTGVITAAMNQDGLPKTSRMRMRFITNVILVLMGIVMLLWVVWVVTIRVQTDDIVLASLRDAGLQAQEQIMYMFDKFVSVNKLNAQMQSTNAVAIGTDGVSANTALDSHFLTMLRDVKSSANATSVYVGLASTGELLGASYISGVPAVMTQAANSDLIFYATTGTKSNEVRNTGSQLARYSQTDARTTTWYKHGASLGKPSGSTVGNTGLSAVYAFQDIYMTVSVVTPFYNSAGALLGVLGVDSTFDTMNTMLSGARAGSTASFVVVERLAEMVASADGEITSYDSNSRIHQLNATHASSTQIATSISELMSEFGADIVASQGSHDFGKENLVSVTAASRALSGLDSHFNSQLARWTLVQVEPRETFFSSFDNGNFTVFVVVFFFTVFVVFVFLPLLESLPVTAPPGVPVSPTSKVAPAPIVSEKDDLPVKKHNSDPQGVDEAAASLEQGRCSCLKRLYDRVKGVLTCFKAPVNPMHCTLQELTKLTRERLQSIVDKLSLEDQTAAARTSALQSKAIEYMIQADEGYPVFYYMSLESYLGAEHLLTRIYSIYLGHRIRSYLHTVLVLLFSMSEVAFYDQSAVAIPLQSTVGVFLTFDGALMLCAEFAGNRGITRVTVSNVAVLLAMWVSSIVHFIEGGQHNVAALLCPLLLLTNHDGMRTATDVILRALVSAATVFYLLFFTVAISAIMLNLFFMGEFEGDSAKQLGSNADNFLEAWVSMFVFLSSAENYEDLVFMGYDVNILSWMFFLPLSLLGNFFLMSLVIATFQDTYRKHKDKLEKSKMATRQASLCPAFVLWTWDQASDQAAEVRAVSDELSKDVGSELDGVVQHVLKELERLDSCELHMSQTISPISDGEEDTELAARGQRACARAGCKSQVWGYQASKFCFTHEMEQVLSDAKATAEKLRARGMETEAAKMEMLGRNFLSCSSFANLMKQYWDARGCRFKEIKSDQQVIRQSSNLGLLLCSTPRAHSAAEQMAAEIFSTIDQDSSGTIEFTEFVLVLAVSRCVEDLRHRDGDDSIHDQLRGSRVITAKWEAALEAAQYQLKVASKTGKAATKAGKTLATEVAHNERFFAIEKERTKRLQDVADHSALILRSITWRTMDYVLLTIICAQSIALALYGHGDVDRQNLLYFTNSASLLYSIEMVARVQASGGLFEYLTDFRRPWTPMANHVHFVLVLATTAGSIAFYFLGEYCQRVVMGLTAVNLFRAFFLEEHCVKLLYAFSFGLRPLLAYAGLLYILYYTYSWAAFAKFASELSTENRHFNTFGHTLLTMFQVFIGEGWHMVMENATLPTTKVNVWFFASYVLACRVFVADFMIGMVIDLFHAARHLSETHAGQVEMMFSQHCDSLDSYTKADLVASLGMIGSVMYNPKEVVLHELMKSSTFEARGMDVLGHRYSSEIIDEFAGNMEQWAVVKLQRQFRKRSSEKRKPKDPEVTSPQHQGASDTCPPRLPPLNLMNT